jgi:hypothetical protein
MKHKSYLVLAASLALLAFAFMLGGLAYAQTGGEPPGEPDRLDSSTAQPTESVIDPGTPGDEAIQDSDSDQPGGPAVDSGLPDANVPAETREEDPQPLYPGAVATVIDDIVQVQGRLTAPNGFPLNGNYSVTVAIYDTPTSGTPRCIDTDSALVTNGLFTMNMDFCTAAVFNGDQLYMGIKVGSDPEMTPRQPIYSVPYAWSLRPGAIVKGADSYVYVPGNALIKNLNTDTTRWDIQANGAARIWRGSTAGTKVIYLPVSLPGVLYGQNVTVERVTVYYRSQNGANSYIDETDLYAATDADSWVQLVTDTNNHTSNVAASYTLQVTQNNVLSNTQGILGLFMYLHFANDTDYLQIGGVRLQLSHQ